MPGPKISRSAFYKWHRANNATYRKAFVEDESDDLY